MSEHGRPPSLVTSIARLASVTPVFSIPCAESIEAAIQETWERTGDHLRAGMRACQADYEKALGKADGS